jgi:hypothetical protein
MGLECTAVFGFGVILTEAECDQVLAKLGIEYDHSEPWEELAAKYGLKVQHLGNALSGDMYYLIGPSHSPDVEFGGPNSYAAMYADMDGCYGLAQMLQESELEQDPGWHLNTLWH